MGACVGRELQGRTARPGDELLALTFRADESPRGGLWCMTPVKDVEGGPFMYRVRFRGTRLDAEAKVVKSLIDLLWVENPHRFPQVHADSTRPAKRQAAAMQCISLLKALRAQQSDAVLDFVVPILNVVLHAPCHEVRREVWENFVVPFAREDAAMGHLFFWALKAVATSPQAENIPKQDAVRKMGIISDAIFSKAQVSATLAQLAEANEAARLGRPIPQAKKIAPGSVTPLVDIFQKLHYIGEEIVKVKDRDERLGVLRRLIQTEINEQVTDLAPVPVQMLAPHAMPTKPAPGATAAVLKLTTEEARVLSSKARAPYLVVLEVDQVDSGAGKLRSGEGGRSGFLGSLCGRRASAGKGSATNWPPNGVSSGSRSSNGNTAHRPKGAFHDETWPEVVQRVRRTSQFGKRPNWSMLPLIVKSNADDVRQEELAYRLLKWFQRIFKRHHPRLWLQPFLIVATSHDGGVLEVVANAISLSDLKKSYGTR
eukprot:CAMPEP_0115137848 /NCGR_PEP_ID=MMETSP0227-20121206/57310_1 /TAXON_ID=89957 /ORGANISM="Polarella glacialis, Strain CCMP 1383" /LENGTH=484 /DNA_ID=CAMNT_0002545345 /DNA_START=113 /DNA_END=1563 /DNA_ORIENTATION=+